MDASTLLALAGLGTAATGAVLGSRAQGQSSDISERNSERLFGLADQERQRRDQLLQMLLPSIMKNMRMGGQAPKIGGQMPGQDQARQTGGLVQPGRPSGGTMGDLGTGATIGMLAGGPVAGAIGAGLGAASNVFGRGRRAANPWTQTTQNDFGQQVSGIIDPFNAAKAGGTQTPESTAKAQEDFQRLLAQYTTSANQYGGSGGQQKRVIDQMWNQFQGPGYIPDWKKTLGLGG